MNHNEPPAVQVLLLIALNPYSIIVVNGLFFNLK